MFSKLKVRGIHIIVGTPARMLDLLRKRIYNLEYCKSIVLYEGFRLIDTAFNEDLYEILDQANV
jgi:superfamily II DNA/RNA helicase